MRITSALNLLLLVLVAVPAHAGRYDKDGFLTRVVTKTEPLTDAEIREEFLAVGWAHYVKLCPKRTDLLQLPSGQVIDLTRDLDLALGDIEIRPERLVLTRKGIHIKGVKDSLDAKTQIFSKIITVHTPTWNDRRIKGENYLIRRLVLHELLVLAGVEQGHPSPYAESDAALKWEDAIPQPGDDKFDPVLASIRSEFADGEAKLEGIETGEWTCRQIEADLPDWDELKSLRQMERIVPTFQKEYLAGRARVSTGNRIVADASGGWKLERDGYVVHTFSSRNGELTSSTGSGWGERVASIRRVDRDKLIIEIAEKGVLQWPLERLPNLGSVISMALWRWNPASIVFPSTHRATAYSVCASR